MPRKLRIQTTESGWTIYRGRTVIGWVRAAGHADLRVHQRVGRGLTSDHRAEPSDQGTAQPWLDLSSEPLEV